MKTAILFFFSSFLLFSCAPTKEAQINPAVVSVYAGSAAQPWLSELYSCADQQSIVLNFTASDPEIYLHVGEPKTLLSPSFQIDEEEILIVTNRESPIQNLTLEQAQALFAGQGDPSVQVWVYSSDEEVQILFDQFVMKGRSVSPSAKLAASPQEMSDLLNTESNGIGILPRHWMAGTVRDVFTVGKVPVLAVTKAAPQKEVKTLMSCLQGN